MAKRMKGGMAPGPATDAYGTTVIDPTANVIRDINAAVRRLDDLANKESKFNIRLHKQEVYSARQENRHLREIVHIKSEYQTKIAKAESRRINAIRAVDVQAVASARLEAEGRATALASQVALSAEAMRVQVAASAAAAATALLGEIGPLKKDIADLRQVQYETAGGKAQGTESQGGYRAWMGIAIAAFIGLSTLALMTLGTIVSVVIFVLNRQ